MAERVSIDADPDWDEQAYLRVFERVQEQWERDGYVRKADLSALLNSLPKFHRELIATRMRARRAEAWLTEAETQQFLPLEVASK